MLHGTLKIITAMASQASACGRRDVKLTDDPDKVECGKCRTTVMFSNMVSLKLKRQRDAEHAAAVAAERHRPQLRTGDRFKTLSDTVIEVVSVASDGLVTMYHAESDQSAEFSAAQVMSLIEMRHWIRIEGN